MEPPLVCENIFEAENNLQVQNTATGTLAKKMISETSTVPLISEYWILSLLEKLYKIINDVCVQEVVARFWQNHLESKEQYK